MKMKIHTQIISGLLLSASQLALIIPAQAAITLDRTRAIYNGDMKSISLNIINENKTYPFLAQSWLDDAQHNKISSPLVVLPPIQRIEAGEHSVVRITKLADAESLPQDRETIFYFNLREIPPKPEKSNVMQLALQTQIKLFYRPKAIEAKTGDIWQEKLVFHKTNGELTVENPTPYYITLSGISRKMKKEGGGNLSNNTGMMIAPKSSGKIPLKDTNVNSFVVTYINDYGGHPELLFSCNGNTCKFASSK